MTTIDGTTEADLARALIDEILSRPVERRFDRDAERDVVNALRVRALRQQLVDTGCYTVDELARGRDSNPNAVHSWLRTATKTHRLIKISIGNEIVVPAVLLDDAFDTNPAWQPVIAALAGIGLDPWAIWAWIATPTGWLDDQTPADLIDTHPDLVTAAARARAATSQQRSSQQNK